MEHSRQHYATALAEDSDLVLKEVDASYHGTKASTGMMS